MPVSSPSYFPPATGGGSIVGTTAGSGATGVRTFLAGANAAKNTQVGDIIVIGDSAFSAGTVGAPLTDANLGGQIIIGSGAVLAQTVSQGQINGANFASIVVGQGAAVAALNIGSSIIVGANALATYVGTTAVNTGVLGTVCIGAGAMQNEAYSFGVTSQAFGNVVVGACAAQGRPAPNNVGTVSQCVVIGATAAQNMGQNAANGGISNSVIIGHAACLTISTAAPASNLVVIGQGAGTGMTNGATNNVIIGQAAAVGAAAMQLTVGIGQAITLTGDSSVVLGAGATTGGMTAGQVGGVFIGQGAGALNTVAGSHQFVLETNISSVARTLLVGNFANGTLVLGKSTQGTDRDQQGTNTLKIINGTKGGGNPLGGGYFYVIAGVLHWVDSAGVDTTVSLGAAGQLASSATAYTNNAGAQAATITNGPTAGNPTKWIPINDNGTIRNVPAW